LKTSSPTTLYEKFADMAMLAYRVGIGAGSAPGYLDATFLREVGVRVGSRLLSYASRFSSRPGRPSASMLLCDIAQLNQEALAPSVVYVAASPVPAPKSTDVGIVKSEDKPRMEDNVYVHPRAVRNTNAPPPAVSAPSSSFELQPLAFFKLVKLRVGELEARRTDGREGQNNVGGS